MNRFIESAELIASLKTAGPIDVFPQVLACGKLDWKNDSGTGTPLSSLTLIAADLVFTSFHTIDDLKSIERRNLKAVFGMNHINSSTGKHEFKVLAESNIRPTNYKEFPDRDLVVLELVSDIPKGKVEPLKIDNNYSLGDSILYSGFGQLTGPNKIRGKISGSIKGIDTDHLVIQSLNSAGQPVSGFQNGDSGGPVLLNGKLIAINDQLDSGGNPSLSKHSLLTNIDPF